MSASLRQKLDPEWCRAEAAQLLAEADRRELLPYRGLPEGSWGRQLLEEEERRRASQAEPPVQPTAGTWTAGPPQRPAP